MDHNVVTADRHFAGQEQASEAACERAARAAGRSQAEADACDDGSVGCPQCPWRLTGKQHQARSQESEFMILNTSDEAAAKKSVTGWVARDGSFWGEDERMARWAGCTHVECACGKPVPKVRTACPECQKIREEVKYAAMPRRVWNGIDMVYSQVLDRYFDDMGDITRYCEEEDVTIETLQLVICEPQYATEIDPNEHYVDLLAEDGEVGGDLYAAFEALNKSIRAYRVPLSWCPGRYAVDLRSLPDQVVVVANG